MIIFYLSLFLLVAGGASIPATQQSLMDDIVGVWREFRDPETGFWCDTLRFTSGRGLAVFSVSVRQEMINVDIEQNTLSQTHRDSDLLWSQQQLLLLSRHRDGAGQ